MSKVLNLIGISDNFNQILVNFIQYVPYNQLNQFNDLSTSQFGSRRGTEATSMPFFDTDNYVINQSMEKPVQIINHEIRVDGNGHSKSFYKLSL